MKVSIIVPTYNEEKNIKDCISTLKEQSYKDFEIIIVDDGSTDGTLKILSVIPDIRIIKASHQGAGPARNLGAEKANGEILVFVDADMTFNKNFISNLIKPILAGKTKGTFSKEEYVSNWNNIWSECWNINSNLPPRKRLPFDYPNKQKVFRAILKSEFISVGGFGVGGYTDDWTLSEKLGYLAEEAKNAVFYHKNPESLREVFTQAKWIGKRKYKYGLVGVTYALFRSSLPISKLVGIKKSIQFKKPAFLIFKIVYDFGIFVGILEYLIFGKKSK
jgi:glycosyltransferase involved in cell wall biosynthesis